MTTSRRTFLSQAIAGTAVALRTAPASALVGERITAVAFDGFAIFDPRPVAILAEDLFPGHGQQLYEIWRTRQFEYTWLRTVQARYVDFLQVTHDALEFSVDSLNLKLTHAVRRRLLQIYLELPPWPDVLPSLQGLKASGIRMTLLSNLTAEMLHTLVFRSALGDFFEEPLSTDRVHAYKPDARAYRLAPSHFALPPSQVAFVAFGGWDAAGAKAFGFPTYWVNRLSMPQEHLGAAADQVSAGLAELPQFIGLPWGI
jgi:2-haloacid dehalogenase